MNQNINTLITTYKELQKKFNDQTREIDEKNIDIKKLFEHLSNTLEFKLNVKKDIPAIEEEIKRIIDEKDDEILDLSKEITEITLTQKILESKRNATIDKMNKTSDDIIGNLDKISGSITKEVDTSLGGKLYTKKMTKKRKKHKKTKMRSKTLRRFKK